MANPTITFNTKLNQAGALRDGKSLRDSLSKPIDIKLNTRSLAQPLGRITGDVAEFTKSLQAATARVTAFGATSGGIIAVSQAISEVAKSVIEVDKQLIELNTFLGQSQGKLQSVGDSLFKIAKNTASSFADTAEAAKEFARQGLSVEETLKRTNDALVLSRISGLGAAESVNALTTAINSFNKSGLDSAEIVNKLVKVDSNFAVSAADLAQALTRVGSAAQDSGVGFEELIAVVTTAQQTTGRGGAIIGNALKTIFTRLKRPEVLDQLQQLGVAVKDQNGALLSGTQILTNYISATKNLGQVEKARNDELLGGVYQINQLKAITNDLAKANGIYARSLEIANSATDDATQKNQELNKSLSAIIQNTKTNFQKRGGSIGEPIIKPLVQRGAGVANFLLDTLGVDKTKTDKDGKDIGETFGQSFLKGVGEAIAGPGLILFGALAVNIGKRLFSFVADASKVLLNINSAVANTQAIEQAINNTLAQQPKITQAILSGQVSREQAAAQLLKVFTLQNQQLMLQKGLASSLAQTFSKGGYVASPEFGIYKNPRRKAAGYIPNFAAEKREAMSYGAGNVQPYVTDAVIGGVSQKVTVNTGETIIPRFGGGVDTAIIPSYRKMEDIPRLAKGYVPNFNDPSKYRIYDTLYGYLFPNEYKSRRTATQSAESRNKKWGKYRYVVTTEEQQRKLHEDTIAKNPNARILRPEDILEGRASGYVPNFANSKVVYYNENAELRKIAENQSPGQQFMSFSFATRKGLVEQKVNSEDIKKSTDQFNVRRDLLKGAKPPKGFSSWKEFYDARMILPIRRSKIDQSKEDDTGFRSRRLDRVVEAKIGGVIYRPSPELAARNKLTSLLSASELRKTGVQDLSKVNEALKGYVPFNYEQATKNFRSSMRRNLAKGYIPNFAVGRVGGSGYINPATRPSAGMSSAQGGMASPMPGQTNFATAIGEAVRMAVFFALPSALSGFANENNQQNVSNILKLSAVLSTAIGGLRGLATGGVPGLIAGTVGGGLTGSVLYSQANSIKGNIESQVFEKARDKATNQFNKLTENITDLTQTISDLDSQYSDPNVRPEALRKLAKREQDLLKKISLNNPEAAIAYKAAATPEEKISALSTAREAAQKESSLSASILKFTELTQAQRDAKAITSFFKDLAGQLDTEKVNVSSLTPQNFNEFLQKGGIGKSAGIFSDKQVGDQLTNSFISFLQTQDQIVNLTKNVDEKLAAVRRPVTELRNVIERRQEERAAGREARSGYLENVAKFAGNFGERASIEARSKIDEYNLGKTERESFANRMRMDSSNLSSFGLKAIVESFANQGPTKGFASKIESMITNREVTNPKDVEILRRMLSQITSSNSKLETLNKITNTQKEYQLKALSLQEKLSFGGGVKTSIDANAKIESIKNTQRGALQYQLGSLFGSPETQIAGLGNFASNLKEKYAGLFEGQAGKQILGGIADQLTALRVSDMRQSLARDAMTARNIGQFGLAGQLENQLSPMNQGKIYEAARLQAEQQLGITPEGLLKRTIGEATSIDARERGIKTQEDADIKALENQLKPQISKITEAFVSQINNLQQPLATSLEKAFGQGMEISNAILIAKNLDLSNVLSGNKNEEQPITTPAPTREEIMARREEIRSGRAGNYSGGFIPNFSSALSDAVSREIGAGYSPSQVKIGQSDSLITPFNRSGLAVFNSTEGSLANGMSLARRAGINPQTKGMASGGFIPNFADETAKKLAQKYSLVMANELQREILTSKELPYGIIDKKKIFGAEFESFFDAYGTTASSETAKELKKLKSADPDLLELRRSINDILQKQGGGQIGLALPALEQNLEVVSKQQEFKNDPLIKEALEKFKALSSPKKPTVAEVKKPVTAAAPVVEAPKPELIKPSIAQAAIEEKKSTIAAAVKKQNKKKTPKPSTAKASELTAFEPEYQFEQGGNFEKLQALKEKFAALRQAQAEAAASIKQKYEEISVLQRRRTTKGDPLKSYLDFWTQNTTDYRRFQAKTFIRPEIGLEAGQYLLPLERTGRTKGGQWQKSVKTFVEESLAREKQAIETQKEIEDLRIKNEQERIKKGKALSGPAGQLSLFEQERAPGPGGRGTGRYVPSIYVKYPVYEPFIQPVEKGKLARAILPGLGQTVEAGPWLPLTVDLEQRFYTNEKGELFSETRQKTLTPEEQAAFKSTRTFELFGEKMKAPKAKTFSLYGETPLAEYSTLSERSKEPTFLASLSEIFGKNKLGGISGYVSSENQYLDPLEALRTPEGELPKIRTTSTFLEGAEITKKSDIQIQAERLLELEKSLMENPSISQETKQAALDKFRQDQGPFFDKIKQRSDEILAERNLKVVGSEIREKYRSLINENGQVVLDGKIIDPASDANAKTFFDKVNSDISNAVIEGKLTPQQAAKIQNDIYLKDLGIPLSEYIKLLGENKIRPNSVVDIYEQGREASFQTRAKQAQEERSIADDLKNLQKGIDTDLGLIETKNGPEPALKSELSKQDKRNWRSFSQYVLEKTRAANKAFAEGLISRAEADKQIQEVKKFRTVNEPIQKQIYAQLRGYEYNPLTGEVGLKGSLKASLAPENAAIEANKASSLTGKFGNARALGLGFGGAGVGLFGAFQTAKEGNYVQSGLLGVGGLASLPANLIPGLAKYVDKIPGGIESLGRISGGSLGIAGGIAYGKQAIEEGISGQTGKAAYSGLEALVSAGAGGAALAGQSLLSANLFTLGIGLNAAKNAKSAFIDKWGTRDWANYLSGTAKTGKGAFLEALTGVSGAAFEREGGLSLEEMGMAGANVFGRLFALGLGNVAAGITTFETGFKIGNAIEASLGLGDKLGDFLLNETYNPFKAGDIFGQKGSTGLSFSKRKNYTAKDFGLQPSNTIAVLRKPEDELTEEEKAYKQYLEEELKRGLALSQYKADGFIPNFATPAKKASSQKASSLPKFKNNYSKRFLEEAGRRGVSAETFEEELYGLGKSPYEENKFGFTEKDVIAAVKRGVSAETIAKERRMEMEDPNALNKYGFTQNDVIEAVRRGASAEDIAKEREDNASRKIESNYMLSPEELQFATPQEKERIKNSYEKINRILRNRPAKIEPYELNEYGFSENDVAEAVRRGTSAETIARERSFREGREYAPDPSAENEYGFSENDVLEAAKRGVSAETIAKQRKGQVEDLNKVNKFGFSQNDVIEAVRRGASAETIAKEREAASNKVELGLSPETLQFATPEERKALEEKYKKFQELQGKSAQSTNTEIDLPSNYFSSGLIPNFAMYNEMAAIRSSSAYAGYRDAVPMRSSVYSDKIINSAEIEVPAKEVYARMFGPAGYAMSPKNSSETHAILNPAQQQALGYAAGGFVPNFSNEQFATMIGDAMKNGMASFFANGFVPGASNSNVVNINDNRNIQSSIESNPGVFDEVMQVLMKMHPKEMASIGPKITKVR